MAIASKKTRRVKVNFMIDEDLLAELKRFVDAGERSDFVNEAMEEAIRRQKHRIAYAGINRIRKEAKLSMTDEEIIRLKNYGRE